MQPHSQGNFFGQSLGKILTNLSKIWAKIGQNQNFVSPKTLDRLRLCCKVFTLQVFAGSAGDI